MYVIILQLQISCKLGSTGKILSSPVKDFIILSIKPFVHSCKLFLIFLPQESLKNVMVWVAKFELGQKEGIEFHVLNGSFAHDSKNE